MDEHGLTAYEINVDTLDVHAVSVRSCDCHVTVMCQSCMKQFT